MFFWAVKGEPKDSIRVKWRCSIYLLSVSLSRHLDFFEMVRNEDDSELAKRFDMVSSLKWLLDNNLFSYQMNIGARPSSAE